MTWQVYLSYRRRTPPNRGGHAVEHGEVHQFDTRPDADDFHRRAQASTGWAPAGAYDLDVSDPIEIHTARPPRRNDAA